MKFEEWLSQQNGVIEVDCGCVTTEAFYHWMRVVYEAGNSPVIPDGYVMVPKVATEKMLIAGLEEADPLGSLIDWDASRGDCNTREQVQGMFEAMLAAAPQDTPALNSLQSVDSVTGGWIPVSERMPEMGEKQRYVLAADFKNNYWPNIPNTQVGVYGDWFDDGNPTWDDGDGEDLHLKEVTHWMPLPAGPKEDVNALIPLVSRNEQEGK
ncbi:DUF551 domain-containing protein [Klebsiella pneumoniae]